MELKVFLAELVTSLARLDFVASLELRTEVFIVKGRVHLTQRGFLEVYLRFPVESIGWQVMAVFIDICGNEAREVIPGERLGKRVAVAEAGSRCGKKDG